MATLDLCVVGRRNLYRKSKVYPTNSLLYPPEILKKSTLSKISEDFARTGKLKVDFKGINLTIKPGEGCSLTASNSFCTGDLIFDEQPILSFSSDLEMLLRFVKLPEQKQKHIFCILNTNYEKLHPDTEASQEILGQLTSHAETMLFILRTHQVQSLSVQNIFDLLVLARYFSHTIDEKSSKSQAMSLAKKSLNTLAIFPIFSTLRHSCAPNAKVSTKAHSGHLVCYALRPICKGEFVTVSFVDSSQPTSNRKRALFFSKLLICKCSMCVGRDYFRSIRCRTKGCCGVKAAIMVVDAHQQSQLSNWLCDVCGDDKNMDARLFSHEQYISHTFSEAKKESISNGSGGNSLNAPFYCLLNKLCEEAMFKLSPTHYLVLELLKYQAFIYSAAAVMCNPTEDISFEFQRESIEASVRAIQILECIDSECRLGINCRAIHRTSHMALQCAFEVCILLTKCAHSSLKLFTRHATRYLPMLICEYGSRHFQLKLIRSLAEKRKETSNNLTFSAVLKHKFQHSLKKVHLNIAEKNTSNQTQQQTFTDCLEPVQQKRPGLVNLDLRGLKLQIKNKKSMFPTIVDGNKSEAVKEEQVTRANEDNDLLVPIKFASPPQQLNNECDDDPFLCSWETEQLESLCSWETEHLESV